VSAEGLAVQYQPAACLDTSPHRTRPPADGEPLQFDPSFSAAAIDPGGALLAV